VKVAAPGGRALTTQLYFPGEPGNARDGIYRRELEIVLAEGQGRFDFVLDLA
jgi:protocatechuate 3,4-dioxygenase beta subunit